MSDETGVTPVGALGARDRVLFWGCFIALVATAFAFIIRVMVMDQWQIAFGLSETQKGEIFGAGLWPFGVSIVLFSLVIDKIGYGRAMVFAFLCHVGSTVLLVSAEGYDMLWMGSVLNGLAAGTVEAVINPVVASMYRKNKTKMLTILHAGWPGGFVLGGLLILGMDALGKLGEAGTLVFGMNAAALAGWEVKVGIILIPTVVYGLVLLRCKFPPNERVAAGIPYKEMLRECGILGAAIVTYMIALELGRVFGWPAFVSSDVALFLVFCFGVYTMAFGRPMYTFLLLIMILLATTELGTDTWIKELMGPAMQAIHLDAGWVLVYTATIMMILRFCIGPIVKVLKPLGVLLVSSLFAAVGLYFLSGAREGWILVAATIYGTGQTFFWPVTIGLCAERFPKGGALTINAIAGVGMLGVGIIGAPLLGNRQDKNIDHSLRPKTAAYQRLIDPKEKTSIFGKYKSLDGKKKNAIYDKVGLRDHKWDLAKNKVAEQVDAGLPKEARKKEIEAEARKLIATEDFANELNADKTYQMLVRNAYDHLVRKKDDKTVKSHAAMVAALKDEGVFVDDEEYVMVLADKKLLDGVTADAKQHAMAWVAILPLIMAACYIGLIIYFKKKGGYKAIDLVAEDTPPE